MKKTQDHDEYIDYSCSTSLERLARDVETVLRKWHVHNGSDRHISKKAAGMIASTAAATSPSRNQTPASPASTPVRGKNVPQQPQRTDTPASVKSLSFRSNHHPRNSLNRSFTASSSSSKTQPQRRSQSPSKTRSRTHPRPTPAPLTAPLSDGSQTHLPNNNNNNKSTETPTSTQPLSLPSEPSFATGNQSSIMTVSLLRSQEIPWTIAFHSPSTSTSAGGRISVDMRLQLQLWDGPPRRAPDILGDDGTIPTYSAASANETTTKGNASTTSTTTSTARTPYSLRAPAASPADLPTDLWDNFSTLFGIGQHITLTPIFSTARMNPAATAPLASKDKGQTKTNALNQSSSSNHHVTFAPGPSVINLVDEAKAQQAAAEKEPAHTDQEAAAWNALWDFVASNIVRRHASPSPAGHTMGRVATQWLQTALNAAAASSSCFLPVFGFWGTYQPQKGGKSEQPKASMAASLSPPPWIQPALALADAGASWQAILRAGPPTRRRRRRFSTAAAGNQGRNPQTQSPVLTGQLTADTCRAHFWCTVLKDEQVWTQLAEEQEKSDGSRKTSLSWTTFASLLLRHCPQPRSQQRRQQQNNNSQQQPKRRLQSPSVDLQRARQVFVWVKPPASVSYRPSSFLFGGAESAALADLANAWRHPHRRPRRGKTDKRGLGDEEHPLAVYRRQCQQHALMLLERASQATDTDPLWGPPDDPIAALTATLTWKPTQHSQTALIALPVKRRSKQKMAQEDLRDMQETIEKSLLDPYHPTRFVLQVENDHETPLASLAATQRCVLASLIRAATLPRQTLLSHLADPAIVQHWNGAAGDRVAMLVAHHATVDPATRHLVTVLDWNNAAQDMLDASQARDLLRRVLDRYSPASAFPEPPSSSTTTANNAAAATASLLASASAWWKPHAGAAPPGRFLSLLFVSMAQVRSTPSMSLIWVLFVEELRRRWDAKSSFSSSLHDTTANTGSSATNPDGGIPHMQVIPGLDDNPEEAEEDAGKLSSFKDKKQASKSTEGGAAAAAEPSYVTSRNLDLGVGGPQHFYNSSIEPDPDAVHCLIGQKLQVFNICLENATTLEMRLAAERRADMRPPSPSVASSSSTDPPAFVLEAARTAMANSNSNYSYNDTTRLVDGVPSPSRTNSGASTRPARRGACYPVPDVHLLDNGEPLYAPYLQRPYPLTDDEIANRRTMLGRQTGSKATLKQLEIVQRFQKPKLLSDMRAFKAANPGCGFQDFVNWYGNPVNPLDFDEVQPRDMDLGAAAAVSLATRLDDASEAIRVLEQTRTFWFDTWNQADPCPADDQEPLFDAANVVEMVLDHLETMHPASLIAQVLAVNLSMACFVLTTSAGDAKNVDVVKQRLDRMRTAVDKALHLVGQDSVQQTGMSIQEESQPHAATEKPMEVKTSVVTVDTISACGAACLAVAEAEVMLSRATSLLHKLPRHYELVQTILTTKDGGEIELKDESARRTLLQTIGNQQEIRSRIRNRTSAATAAITEPLPAVHEYVFRSQSDVDPCQLCVKYSDQQTSGQDIDAKTCSLILALTKTAQ